MTPRAKKTEIHREVQELSLLFAVSQILDHSMDLREVVGLVLKAIAENMGMMRGALILINRETGELAIQIDNAVDAIDLLMSKGLTKAQQKLHSK